jgi:hypothetical protein
MDQMPVAGKSVGGGENSFANIEMVALKTELSTYR